MTQETEHERYVRLNALIDRTYDDHELTGDEKHELGEILAENMTPWEYNCEVSSIGDIWYGILEDYRSLNDLSLTLAYIAMDNCESVDDWIYENGLPLPDADDMIDRLTGDIDEQEYINDNYEDVLDMLPEQCKFNMSDTEIINLFETYVDEPDEDSISGEMVRCNVADKYGCTVETCYHAVDHPYGVLECGDTHCDKYHIDVVCEGESCPK